VADSDSVLLAVLLGVGLPLAVCEDEGLPVPL
jgi:hypothetical protein